MPFIHYLSKLILSFVFRVFWIFPTKKNRLFLLNDMSFTYGDNLKYLNEYLQKYKKDKFEIIFPLKSKTVISHNCISIKPHSLLYFYYILTSKIIITNAGGISYLPFRKNQIIINTWHGGGPYKKTGASASSNKFHIKEFKMNSKKTTYMLSTSKNFDEFEAKALYMDKEKLIKTGSPRNDVFFENQQKIIDSVKKYFNIPLDKKIILYAPTFRDISIDTNSKRVLGSITLDYKSVVTEFNKKFGGDWVIAFRLHPRLNNEINLPNDVLNFSLYPDMQELLLAADAVITDYSSLMWDFSLTGKPCLLYADDIEEYEKTRGFYMPSYKWPYPLAHNNDELAQNIKTFDINNYRQKVKQHHLECGSYENGKACEITIGLIEKNL